MKISVVMATKNNESEIEIAMNSILDQTLKPAEIIVINDGSTDQTGQILERYKRKDPSLRVFHQENKGLTKSLAFGCEIASNQLIARMDADDSCHPLRLELQAQKFLEKPSLAFCGTWTNLVDPEVGTLYKNCAVDNDKKLKKFLQNGINPFVHGSIMINRNIYCLPGNQYQWNGPAQDYDLWLRLSRAGTIGTVERILYTYNYSPNGISITKQKQQRAAVKKILNSTSQKQKIFPDRNESINNTTEKELLLIQAESLPREYIDYQRAIHAILCKNRIRTIANLASTSKGTGIYARKSRRLLRIPLALKTFEILLRWRFKNGIGKFLEPIDLPF